MIYLDYAASTQVADNVLSAYYNSIKNNFANPNSSHRLGQKSAQLLDNNTNEIASYLGVNPNEIIYTSGATESNNLVIKGISSRYKNRGKHIILSALEHNSLVVPATNLVEKGFEVSIAPLNNNGTVDITMLKELIREDTILVSICSIDSEIGIIEPINEIGKYLKKEYPNIIFHTDASQLIGKAPFDFTYVDLITIAPHKFYGLPNTGLLIKKNNIDLKPQITGGKSTTIYRSGTPSLADVISIKESLKYALNDMDKKTNYVKKLNNMLRKFFTNCKNVIINSPDDATPYILNISLKNGNSIDFIKKLEEQEIYVSSKTSCCPIYTPSKLVYALTKDKNIANNSIRISLSHLTTEEEIKKTIEIFNDLLGDLYEKE